MTKFKSHSYKTRVSRTHIVMVDGEEMKSLCTRQSFRHGEFVSEFEDLTCDSCTKRGWIYGMSPLSEVPIPKDEHGRYLSRT